jgi:hypothetical protein
MARIPRTSEATAEVSAADLRALLARHRVRLYEVGALLGLHPSRVGLLLNERTPLDADTALRIQETIELIVARRAR